MVSPGNYPLEVLSISIRSHCLRVLSRMTAGTVPYVMLQVKYGMSSPELIPKMAMVAVLGCSAFKWDSWGSLWTGALWSKADHSHLSLSSLPPVKPRVNNSSALFCVWLCFETRSCLTQAETQFIDKSGLRLWFFCLWFPSARIAGMPPHLAIKKPHFFIWRLSQLLHYINVKQTTSTYSLSQKKKKKKPC